MSKLKEKKLYRLGHPSPNEPSYYAVLTSNQMLSLLELGYTLQAKLEGRKPPTGTDYTYGDLRWLA